MKTITHRTGPFSQVLRKTEGNAMFDTAMSTAFLQPAPGSAPKPGPLKVGVDELRIVLGITDVHYSQGTQSLAIVDDTLG